MFRNFYWERNQDARLETAEQILADADRDLLPKSYPISGSVQGARQRIRRVLNFNGRRDLGLALVPDKSEIYAFVRREQ